MTVFVQKFKDGRTNKYEVFRRSTAPEDSTLAVEDTRQAAIATAGQLANPSEAIRESADQNDFGIIREGDVAPGPGDNPSLDPAGGFFESSDDFTPALNENQAPLGSVDDSLDNLFGEPSGEGGEEPSLDDTLDSLFGEDDPNQRGVIEQGQDLLNRALGRSNSDESDSDESGSGIPFEGTPDASELSIVNRDTVSTPKVSQAIAERGEGPVDPSSIFDDNR